MAINFPSSPSLDEIFEESTSGNYYIWNGYAWVGYASTNLQLNYTASTISVEDDNVLSGAATTIDFGENLSVLYSDNRAVVSGATGITSTVNINTSGIITAHSFYGSGVGLTSIPAGELTGSLPALDGSSLTGIIATGSGVELKNNDSIIGTAATINFDSNFNVSNVLSGISTISLATTYISNSGYSTYSNYSNFSGISTYSSTSGIASYSDVAGISSGVSTTVNINTSGIITAHSFYGSGVGLTSIPAGELTGSLPALDGSALINLTAVGSGITVSDGFSIFSASVIDFGEHLTVSYDSGTATVDVSSSPKWNDGDSGIHTSSSVGIGTTVVIAELTVKGHANISGVLTANTFSGSFIGDGSGLTGVIAEGTGIEIKDSSSVIGVAATIDFANNLNVSPLSAGIVTVSSVNYWSENSSGIHTLSNVGIGTTIPYSTLSVYGSVYSSTIVNSPEVSSEQITIRSQGLYNDSTIISPEQHILINNNNVGGDIILQTSYTDIVGTALTENITLYSLDNDAKVRVHHDLVVDQKVGIGTTNTTNTLTINGGISANALNISGVSTLGFVTTSQLYVTGVTTSLGGFIGSLTGTATGLSGTPNLNVGVVTATNFVGSLSGNADSATVSGYASTSGIASAVASNININTSGIITAHSFYGSGVGLTSIPAGELTGSLPALDGSALFGVVASGVAITVRDNGSPIGSAEVIDFADNLSVSFSSGIATITGLVGVDWALNDVGIHTLLSVGIGTTNPTSTLTVNGNTSLETLDVSGISTFPINVSVGVDFAHQGNIGKFRISGDDVYGNGRIGFYDSSNNLKAAWNSNLYTGSIDIYNYTNSGTENITISAGSSVVLQHGGTNTKLQTLGAGVTITGTTFTDQLNVSGVSTFNGGTYYNSPVYYSNNPTRAYFGSLNEMSIYSTGTYLGKSFNFIDASSGYLDIRNYRTTIRNSEVITQRDLAVFDANTFNAEFVKLYYGGNEKFATIGAGVTVTGTTFTNQLNVSGIASASNLYVTGISTHNRQVTFAKNGSIDPLQQVVINSESESYPFINVGSGLFYFNSPNTIIRNTYGGGRILMDSQSGIDFEQYGLGGAYRARFDNTNVSLYSSNSLKFQTVGTGITVYGTTETQKLSVSGIATAASLGIGTTNPVSSLQVERHTISTGIGTFDALVGSAHTFDSFNLSTHNFKTIEYTLYIQNGGSIQSNKVLIMQNGVNAYSQEYALMFDNAQIVSVGATISSGVCNIRLIPQSGISGLTTYTFTRGGML